MSLCEPFHLKLGYRWYGGMGSWKKFWVRSICTCTLYSGEKKSPQLYATLLKIYFSYHPYFFIFNEVRIPRVPYKCDNAKLKENKRKRGFLSEKKYLFFLCSRSLSSVKNLNRNPLWSANEMPANEVYSLSQHSEAETLLHSSEY